MKHFTFYISFGILLLYLMTESQGCYGQLSLSEIISRYQRWNFLNRIENRKVDDPIYETGDTLYLFYDWTDSLQIYDNHNLTYRSKEVLWKIRELTQEEKEQDAPPEYDGWMLSDKWYKFYLQGIHGRKPEIWTFDDLKGIILTSRKEFLDFYQREYVRKKGKHKEGGEEMRMCLSEYDFGNHFSCIYMLIPRSDGKFELYRIETF